MPSSISPSKKDHPESDSRALLTTILRLPTTIRISNQIIKQLNISLAMSQQEIKDKARETLKSAQELMSTLTDTAHKELAKSAPKLTNALDNEFEKATNAFSDTINTIGERATKEQN